MNTTTSSRRPRRPLSRVDLAILGLHAVGAVILGVSGFFNVTEGWETLQRIVVLMMVALWAGGILAMSYLARVIFNPWIRLSVLLAGPFIGIAALVVQAQV